MKTVYKPWGKEEWLELNDRYCYKRIYINKGARTSFQYHEKKLETNDIIQGEAEVWLEDDDGILVKTIMHAGDFFTVIPLRKHRVIALTDLIMQEVSTPEVDDIIRIQDDSSRDHGRIEGEHKTPALCILAAGMGNRLGKYTDHINKSLLPIDNSAVITHIIDKAPKGYDIIVVLGYKADQVRDYCLAAHPERNFEFIRVDSFDPKDSGPSTSLYACKDILQRPFYFCACDVFIEEDGLPHCSSNWLGLSRTVLSEIYATVELDKKNKVVRMKDKCKSGFDYAWIGLMSVFDYETFWENYDKDELEIPSVIQKMIEKINFGSKFYTWYDLGTLDNYHKGKKIVEMSSGTKRYDIPKVNGEFFYKVKDRVIKINQSAEYIRNLAERFKELSSNINVPEVVYCENNVLSYRWIDGKTLYEVKDTKTYDNFLSYCKENMWKIAQSPSDEEEIIQKFYVDRLKARIDLLLQASEINLITGPIKINGQTTRSLEEQIKSIVSYFSDNHRPIFVRDYHGDFHFENILFDEKLGFSFLDIRPNFGHQKEVGDVYYDLSKLYAGLVVNFSDLKDKDKFDVSVIRGDTVILEIEKNKTLDEFRRNYELWLADNNYNIQSVKTIAASVLIGIAALHDVNQSEFLYYSGRKLLDDK